MMIKVSFYSDPEDALPRSQIVDTINAAQACDYVQEIYPNAVILFWEWV